jgi:hypothetical protein
MNLDDMVPVSDGGGLRGTEGWVVPVAGTGGRGRGRVGGGGGGARMGGERERRKNAAGVGKPHVQEDGMDDDGH